MLKTNKYLLLAFAIPVLGFFFSCEKWEGHLDRQNIENTNLMELIGQEEDLSLFAKYLEASGVDSILISSVNFTVWAPDNAALEKVPDSIKNDKAKLKKLMLNHISQQLVHIENLIGTDRIGMLSGKYQICTQNTIGGAEIVKSGSRAKNGILNVIGEPLNVLPTIWDLIYSKRNDLAQSHYLAALNYSFLDSGKAEIQSIDPSTSKPIYVPGTGIVNSNPYFDKVWDISREDRLFTCFLLTDEAFKKLKEGVIPYFKSSDPEISDSNAAWNVVKDLVFKGLYSDPDFPNEFISRSGVHVQINKSAISQEFKASNGVVYLINDLTWPLDEKIPAEVIQGIYPDRFSSNSETFLSKVFYRSRMNELTGQYFKDIYLFLGSGGANSYVDFSTNNLFTTRYKVYWMAYNDFVASGQGDADYGTKLSLSQILQIGNYADSVFTPVFEVDTLIPPASYEEMYLGEFENTAYDWVISTPAGKDTTRNLHTPATIRLRIKSPVTVLDGAPHNLTVSYLKLVPEIDD